MSSPEPPNFIIVISGPFLFLWWCMAGFPGPGEIISNCMNGLKQMFSIVGFVIVLLTCYGISIFLDHVYRKDRSHADNGDCSNSGALQSSSSSGYISYQWEPANNAGGINQRLPFYSKSQPLPLPLDQSNYHNTQIVAAGQYYVRSPEKQNTVRDITATASSHNNYNCESDHADYHLDLTPRNNSNTYSTKSRSSGSNRDYKDLTMANSFCEVAATNSISKAISYENNYDHGRQLVDHHGNYHQGEQPGSGKKKRQAVQWKWLGMKYTKYKEENW